MQVASSFLIEVGNGDKFLFDMGSGSYQNLLATGNYAIDKVSALRLCQPCRKALHPHEAVAHLLEAACNGIYVHAQGGCSDACRLPFLTLMQ